MLTFNWASAVCRGRTTEFHHVSSILYTSRHSHGSDMDWLGTWDIVLPGRMFPRCRPWSQTLPRPSWAFISKENQQEIGPWSWWRSMLTRASSFQMPSFSKTWKISLLALTTGVRSHCPLSWVRFCLRPIGHCWMSWHFPSLPGAPYLLWWKPFLWKGIWRDLIYIYIYVYIIVILIWRWGANGCDLYCTDYSNVNVQWLMRSFLQDIPCGISSKTYHVAMVIHGYRL